MKTKITGKRLLSAGLMLAALSCGGAKTDSAEGEVRRLETEIPALYLVNGMFLSADQARQLAGFLAESVKIHEQNQKEIRLFFLNHQREIDLLLDQMVAGKKEERGQTPRFAKGRQNMQLHKVRHEWQNLLNRGQNELDDIARKTLAMLTPAQRDILDRFVPCFVPPGDFRNPERVGQADGDASLGDTMLARLRRSPAEKLNDAVERALDKLVPYIMKERHTELTKPQMDELRDELRPSLKELTTRIRNMNDSDFELEKSKLAKEFLCLNEAQDAGQGGNELGKIKHYLLNPGIAPVISRRAGNPASPRMEEVAPTAVTEEIKQKAESFRAANLVNNLLLTAGQSGQLLPCVRKAAAARAETDLEANAIFPQALQAYIALKNELENQQISQPTEQEAQKYHHQLRMLYLDKLSRTILECQSEMDRLLSVDQVVFLIGRQNRKNDDRAQFEQAKKNISVVRLRARGVFDKMDQMKDAEFTAHCHDLCAQFVETCLSLGLIDQNDFDKAAEITRAEQTLARARHMNRSEYNKNRDDLIAEICPRRNAPRPAMFGWQKTMDGQMEVVNSNTQLLFSRAGLELLEKKVKAGN